MGQQWMVILGVLGKMEMCREETKQDMGECARRPTTYECLCKTQETQVLLRPSPVV
jgi:hypothetical protein